MAKIIFLFYILLFSLYAKQTQFSLQLEKPFETKLCDVSQNYDRSISAVGISKNFAQQNSSHNTVYTDPFSYLRSQANKYGATIHIIKTDLNGLILQDQSYPLENFHEAKTLSKTPFDGYLIGTSRQDGSLAAIEFDHQAKLLSTHIFGTSNHNELKKVLVLKDGGFLAVADSITTRSSKDQEFIRGLGGSDISLTRFSKRGKLLWTQKYGSTQNDHALDIIETQGGSFILLSSIDNLLTLSKLSEHGEKQWQVSYDKNEEIEGKSLLELRDQSYLLSTLIYDTQRKKQINFLHYSKQGKLLDTKLIATSYSSTLHDLKLLNNSHIVAVGEVQDGGDTDALFIHLDQDLNLVCQNHFGSSAHDSFRALDLLHNSNVAAVGSYTKEGMQESSMWLATLDLGCELVKLEDKTKEIQQQLHELLKEEQKAKEISFKEDLYFDLNDTQLYFSVGGFQLTEKQKKFLDRFSPKLISWLVQHKDKIQSLEINGHTSSEWSNVDLTQRYLKNSELSMKRSFSVLSYIFSKQKPEVQEYLSSIIRGSGFAYVKMKKEGNKEDKEHSRRVSFKIILK